MGALQNQEKFRDKVREFDAKCIGQIDVGQFWACKPHL